MKLLALLASSLVIGFTIMTMAHATTTTTTTKVVTKTETTCKPDKKHRKQHVVAKRIHHTTGYCNTRRSRCNPCGYTQYCYPELTYQCHTELDYRHGRNHAKVEVCH